MENLSIEFQPTVVEIQKEVVKAVKLNRWPENKAKRVYNKAVSVYTYYILSSKRTRRAPTKTGPTTQYSAIGVLVLIAGSRGGMRRIGLFSR